MVLQPGSHLSYVRVADVTHEVQENLLRWTRGTPGPGSPETITSGSFWLQVMEMVKESGALTLTLTHQRTSHVSFWLPAGRLFSDCFLDQPGVVGFVR